MIVILGAPRSGTSYISSLLEQLGLRFDLQEDNKIDEIYYPHVNYYQRKDLHFLLYNTEECINFKNSKKNILLPNVEIIKEPYLLFVLNSIRHQISKIILIIRNPTEVIASSRIWLNNNNSNQFIDYTHWNKYYLTFLKNVGDIPYIIINYNNFQDNFEEELNKIKLFLNIQNNNKININFKNEQNYDLANIPSDTKYIYLSFINNKTTNILTNYKKYKNLGPNDVCFCNSKKKYKKCCYLINLKK